YHGRLEPVQFAYSLLTRSLRVTHENLRTRDPKLVAAVERWFAERAAAQTGCAVMAAPPMSTPFRLRDVVLDNRLVVERAGTPGAISLSDRIRHEAGIPTLVGAEVDTRPDINSVLAAGRADLCVIRPSRAPSLASAMQQPLWS